MILRHLNCVEFTLQDTEDTHEELLLDKAQLVSTQVKGAEAAGLGGCEDDLNTRFEIKGHVAETNVI